MNAIEYYQKVLTNVIKDIIINFNYLRHIKLQLKDRAHITFTFYQLEDTPLYFLFFSPMLYFWVHIQCLHLKDIIDY